MNNAELVKREERAERETLIIGEVDDGFRVYSVSDPKTIYLVTGSPEAPECSCPDFRFHSTDPAWRCKHILAVQNLLTSGSGATTPADPDEAEERRAIQEESRTPRKRRVSAAGNGNGTSNGLATMLLKRSVSPDGRIDSLSVEFSCPVDGIAAPEIELRAKKTLSLQSIIVDAFRGQQRRAELQAPKPAPEEKSPAVPARLVNVAGMDTKWGRRLFMNVEVNGDKLKLFGKKTQLAEHLMAAGFAEVAQHVAEGLTLNLPCRVIIEPSADGKYTNVVKVLPAGTQMPRTRQ